MTKIYHPIAGILLLFFGVQACTQRSICPAYQSAFIHDKDVLERHFSYFGEDTLPKIMEASKDRYLIIEPMSYRKKLRSLQTVAMEDVYPHEEDSLDFNDEFYLAEREGYDSTAVISVDTLASTSTDSVYMISLKKEKFNIDQELYLWYLKDYLVYPDVRIQMQVAAEQQAEQQKEEKKKKGIFGFFKNIFKKKNKSDSTNAVVEPANAVVDEKKDKKEKKGLFGIFKKKGKKKKPNKEIKEEEEEVQPQSEPSDDGEDNF